MQGPKTVAVDNLRRYTSQSVISIIIIAVNMFVPGCWGDDNPTQPQSSCSISTTSLNFGTVNVGSSTDRTLTITNTGGGTLTGSTSESCSHYSIVSGGGSYSLGAGQSRTVTVRFAPTSLGTKTCSISTGTSCSSVSCTGVGQEQPQCQVSPTSLDFSTVNVGYASNQTFTITNAGGGTLTGSTSESCAPYSIVSGGGSYSLEAGQSRAVTVRFAPTSTGTNNCFVSLGTSCPSVYCTGSGQNSQCQVSPTSLDFGAVNVGSSADRTFTITNTGGGTLTGSVSESFAHYSIISGGGSYSLGAGQSRSVSVQFSPTSSGTISCTISTGTSCSDVSCSGHAIGSTQCQVSPTSLDFGTVNVGSSADRTFTITNTGGGTLTGSTSESCSHYSIVSGGGSYSLGAGQSRTVMVRFAPTSSGTKTCSIITGASCSSVGCSGHAIESTQCQVSPTSLDFGTVNVGSSADRTFTITNTGGGTLTGSTSESCSHYSIVSGGGSYSLGAGQSRTVMVRFAPTSSGTKTCSIITGASCSSVGCSGHAIESTQCQVSPTSLDFGTVNVGSSADRTFTITNTGGGTLTGSTSESCSHYSIVSGGGSYSLGAGQSRTVMVRFAPTSSGTKTCSIITGTSCSGVSCSGVGQETPQCQVSPTSLDFGSINVGSASNQTFTITNAGGGTLTGSVSESCTHYSIVSGDGSYSLGAGQSRTVTIRFAPTSSGSKTCSVSTGCAGVTCIGIGIQSVYLNLFFSSSGFGLGTNNPAWSTLYLKFDSNDTYSFGVPSWLSCSGGALILDADWDGDARFFPSECNTCFDPGLSVASACNQIKVEIEYQPQSDDADGCFYSDACESSCSGSYAYSSGCIQVNEYLTESCSSSSSRINFTLVYRDNEYYDSDFAVKSMRFTFYGWHTTESSLRGELIPVGEGEQRDSSTAGD